MAHALSGELAPDRCTGPLAMTSARTTSAIDGIVRGARCIGKRRHCPHALVEDLRSRGQMGGPRPLRDVGGNGVIVRLVPTEAECV